jgi:hypothetical protein
MNRINVFTFSLLAIVGFVCLDCEKLHEDFYSIVIENQSGHVMISYERLKDGARSDTILPVSKPTLLPGAKNLSRSIDSLTPWDVLYNAFPEDSISMHIFFFHPDTISKYSWEEIKNGYRVMYRYDLSLSDLERLNYRLTYPPNASMEEVKIWPQE